MDPSELGKKYDKIAPWWQDEVAQSSYGIDQVEKALQFAPARGKALDVGCGSGGRFVGLLEDRGYAITGLDVSQRMVKLARTNHPVHTFLHEDICSWETEEKFDFILAWDSIFHLPLPMQYPVLSKLCEFLKRGGVLIYSFGNAEGEDRDQWKGDIFYYSSIGIDENLQILIDSGLSLLHLEQDQYPEKHVYAIARKE